MPWEGQVEQKTGDKKYLKVKDAGGNVFICPLSALKRVEDATEKELADCVEGDVVGRYAGDIEIVK